MIHCLNILKAFYCSILLTIACLSIARAGDRDTTKSPVMPYGKIDTADLKLTTCSFEPDANAMVLFDKANVYFGTRSTLVERHIRIKVLNEKGKDAGNIRITYKNKYYSEYLVNVRAETINLNDGKIVISALDPKLIYDQHTDKTNDAIVFSMPDVKAGSVIDYTFTLGRSAYSKPPTWYFQNENPTRYSEFDVLFSASFQFKVLRRVTQRFLKDTVAPGGGHVWAMANVPSAKLEPFMRSVVDDLQSVSLLMTAITVNGALTGVNDSWHDTGKEIVGNKDFYKFMDQNISGEDVLLKQAKTLNTDDEKIAFLFNEVKKTMKWNKSSSWFSGDGIKSVWKLRSGNSGEINMIVYHLLKQAGIKVYPMLVSTRENGSLVPDFVDLYQINSIVAYVPVDSTKYYVLDASDKYNSYDTIPADYLNSYGLTLDKEKNRYELVHLTSDKPVLEVTVINAEIEADSKMNGDAEIDSHSYRRMARLELYQTAGEDKFIEYLTGRDNNLKITSLKVENTLTDTLPLKQTFSFTLELSNSGDYIYFNPNIFTSLRENPFLEEKRNSPIDFGFMADHIISAKYKMPPGYKIESLPKTTTIVMADKSIRFRRTTAQEDGFLQLYYIVNIKKSLFSKEDYPTLRKFYQKMYEMLNEQIVFKKI